MFFSAFLIRQKKTLISENYWIHCEGKEKILNKILSWKFLGDLLGTKNNFKKFTKKSTFWQKIVFLAVFLKNKLYKNSCNKKRILPHNQHQQHLRKPTTSFVLIRTHGRHNGKKSLLKKTVNMPAWKY